MRKDWHGKLALLIVILFGIVLYGEGTDGFRAFTAESARTYELMRSKPVFPNVTLEDSQNRTFPFADFAKGKYVLLTFMYSSCTTVCPQLEANMAEVYQKIPRQYLGKDIAFLSITFDPARDTPKVLQEYGTYFGIDGETWRLARVRDQAELQALLKQLGVVVIPDENGNFTHNAAFYLIGKDAHLLKVLNFTKTKDAANTVIGYLGQQTGG